uniref:hypothetical protein n=1 Tax=Mycobacteroides immunogenum TaxID=83262 RepID=UPI00191C1518|nr:hypothetical protein [Mycobacteroides immunogenum]
MMRSIAPSIRSMSRASIRSSAAPILWSTFSAVSGASVEAMVIYKDTGTVGTSPLIAYIDTATGLPVSPNGGDINIAWDTGTNKIFKL